MNTRREEIQSRVQEWLDRVENGEIPGELPVVYPVFGSKSSMCHFRDGDGNPLVKHTINPNATMRESTLETALRRGYAPCKQCADRIGVWG